MVWRNFELVCGVFKHWRAMDYSAPLLHLVTPKSAQQSSRKVALEYTSLSSQRLTDVG